MMQVGLFNQVRRWRDAELLLAFGAALFVLALAWQAPGPITVDVGGPDGVYLSDFHPTERNADRDYRWTPGGSELNFPGVGWRAWQVTLVAAAGARPGGPVALKIRANGETIFTAAKADPDFHAYTFLVPARDVQAGDLKLEIDIPDFRPPGENRDLGLAIDKVALDSQLPRAPAPIAWLALAGALVALYASLKLASRRVALIGGAAATLLMAVVVAVARLYITPYASYLFMIAALTYVGLYATRGLLRRFTVGGSTATSPGTERLALALVLTVALAYALIVFGGQITFLSRLRVPDDFSVFYNAAGRLYDGKPLYELNLIKENPLGGVYKYPPLFALFLIPLAKLPDSTALSIWQLANLGLLALALYAILRAHDRRLGGGSPASLLFIAVALIYQPVVDTLVYGQMDISILGLVALAYAALRAGKPAWAGLPLAVAVLFKLYPAILLIYLVMRREWRALAGFAASCAALVLGALLFTGIEPWQTYITHVLPASGGSTAWVENQSFVGFLGRLFAARIELVEFPHPKELWVQIVTWGGYAWAVLVLAVSFLWARRDAARHTDAYALGFGIFTAASVLMLPAAWYHYMTLMLLPIGIAFMTMEQRGAGWWAADHRRLARMLVLLAASVALLAYASFWLVWNGTDLGGLWRLGLSFKFYGLVGLWAACLSMLAWVTRGEKASSVEEAQESASEGAGNEKVLVG